MHQIKFRKVTDAMAKVFKGVPLCVKAEGDGPPEDVGGVPGFEEFLRIVSNKKHPEYKSMIEWSGLQPGDKPRPGRLDTSLINERLADLYHSEEWNWDDDDSMETRRFY